MVGMTDRHAAYIVVLEKDLREDDAQATLRALGMVRGVHSVEPVMSSPEVYIGTQRALGQLRQELAAVLWPPRKTEG